jgi:ABC-type dipeptide/oligopeptide/nickel transport system permease subunit
VTVAEAPIPARPDDDEPAPRRRGYWNQSLRRVSRQPVTIAAFAVLVLVFVAGALAPALTSTGWNTIDLSSRWYNHAPTLAGGHVLGTDNIGRDTLTRLLWGLHYTEQTALVGGLAATLLALAIGTLAGYVGGWPDALLMRLADLVTGFPVLLLLVATFVWLRPVTVWEATLVFSVAMWPFAARVLRARTASLGAEEFVQAAHALGASNRRIVLRHVLPNAAGAIVVSATSLIGQIVLIEATAEFFGFGVRSVTRPTLGNLIGEATSGGIGEFNPLALGWWTWAMPAIVLITVLACVNLVGDGLDAALNPRATHR